MTPNRQAAHDITQRLLGVQARLTRLTLLVDLFCRSLREQGVPLDRCFVTLRQLHPLIAARSIYWDAVTGGSTEVARSYDVVNSDAYRASPMRPVFEEQKTLHLRIDDALSAQTFPIIRELREQGFTDYLAFPLRFSGRRTQAITLASKQAGGFTAEQVALVEAVLPALTAVLELNQQRHQAQALLATYVGPRTGERIWAGEIRRGQGEHLHAVFMLCDLRGFTNLAAQQSLEDTIEALNGYFDALGGAIERHGGEILKFIGDAILAIFPCATDEAAIAEAGNSAYQASREGLAALAALNEKRALPLVCGIGLHVGEALYGNIGTAQRLDFTVIGSAVNQVARLESLAGSLGQTIIVSSDLAPRLTVPLRSLGRHQLKGLQGAIQAFTPA